MIGRLGLAAVVLLTALTGWAEPRWCQVTGKEPAGAPAYPEQARAARVHGQAAVRIVYLPNGKVLEAAAVAGPELLTNPLMEEARKWTVHTEAAGAEPCQTVVVADFRFVEGGLAMPNPPLGVQAQAIFEIKPASQVEPPPAAIENFEPIEPPGRLKRVQRWVMKPVNWIIHRF